MPANDMQSNTAAEPDLLSVVVTGGGSGGHTTPLLAVAHSLKSIRPDVHITYIGERGGRLGDIVAGHELIDRSYLIFAGKLRRYHGEGIKQLLDVVTILKNIRDIFLTFIGFWQALWRLWRIKPAVIFIKGGFVSVPVGLAAALLRIPYVTHDSDSVPGLANRLVAPWAAIHAVGMPKEFYRYPALKTIVTGVPLSPDFRSLTPESIQQYREELDISEASQVIFVTGGGLGATRLNKAVWAIAERLLLTYPDLYLLHGVGRGNETEAQRAYESLHPDIKRRLVIKDFIKDLYRYSGAADIVITRGSATALAEFALQSKACIVVPNPYLTGGHQLKNAEYLNQAGAALVVSEDELKQNESALLPAIIKLIDDPKQRVELGEHLHKFAYPDASARIAELLLQYAKEKE